MTGETWSEALARAERARREGRRWIEIGRMWWPLEKPWPLSPSEAARVAAGYEVGEEE